MIRKALLRERILAAAKDLIWERGFEAMSPRDVMDRSGAGQGSLYHHFRSKRALALAAIGEMKQEEMSNLDSIFAPSIPPLERISRYFARERQALRGCRLARIANETSIEDPLLRQPVCDYLGHVTALLSTSLAEAQKRGELPPDVRPEQIGATLMAIVEGGYVLARVHWDEDKMRQALAGGMDLLEWLRLPGSQNGG